MKLGRRIGGRTAPLVLLAVPLLVAIPVGCGASATPASRVSLVARDIAYEPAHLVVTVGEPVVIAMQNVGAIDHDLNVDGITVRDVEARDATTGGHRHSGKLPALHVAASPGKTATVRFVPIVAGTFEVWCSVPGHREAGMLAILEVREARS